jgi:hypothetical protein
MAGAFVQGKSINLLGTGPQVTTVTLDSPTVAGNTLIACFSAYDTGSSPGWPYINDANASWTPGADQWSWTTFNGVCQIQYALNIPARSPYSLQVDVPNCEYFQVFIMEVSGVKVPTAIEVNNIVQAQAAGLTARSGSVTPTAASFLVAALTEDTGTLVNSVTAGWTERYDGNTGQPLHVATRSGAASTAAECVFTAAASMSSSAGVILGLQEAVAAPTTHYGAVVMPSTFGAVTQGKRKTFGVVARPSTFSAVVQARRKTFGQVAMPVAFGATTQARRKTFGAVAAPFTDSIYTAGDIAAYHPVTHYGQLALPITFAAAAQAKKHAFSSAAIPAGFSATVQGKRQTFGVVARQSIFASDTQARRRTFSQVVLPLTAHFATKSIAPEDIEGTQLNLADAVYLGDRAVDAVYAGDKKAWP